MICRMPDELPVEVFTELGRVTWAAIKLEDYVGGVCSHIDPSNPRTDRRQISAKIKDAKKVLASLVPFSARDDTIAWLDRAGRAIEQRNAVLHAVPVVRIGPQGRVTDELLLGEMPRKRRGYFERPLTVESLSQLRANLEDAATGWQDILLSLGTDVLP
jgi:hypothetical protein